jgi:hypothetical protein
MRQGLTFVSFKRTQLTFSEHGCWVSVEERVLTLPPIG